MKELLSRLEGAPGVRGALVMTLDGIVVSSLGDDELAERMAAFVSATLLAITKDAEELGLVPFQRLTLWEAKARVVVMPTDSMALVVVADRDTDLTDTLLEVQGLAQGLIRQTKIDIEV